MKSLSSGPSQILPALTAERDVESAGPDGGAGEYRHRQPTPRTSGGSVRRKGSMCSWTARHRAQIASLPPARGKGGDGTPPFPGSGSCLFLLSVLHGHFAAALRLATVLARAAGVPGLATPLRLAGIVALAGVLLGGRAAALRLATVLARTAGDPGLAASLALTGVPSLADVLVVLAQRRSPRGADHGGPSHETCRGGRDQLPELPTRQICHEDPP